jgi:hypothetical protein
LNEADRMQEKVAAELREESRKKERATRKERLPTTYEITVKDTSTPDLPAPETAVSAPVLKSSEFPADEMDEAEARIPQSDPALRESERILADYLGILHRPASVAKATH